MSYQCDDCYAMKRVYGHKERCARCKYPEVVAENAELRRRLARALIDLRAFAKADDAPDFPEMNYAYARERAELSARRAQRKTTK